MAQQRRGEEVKEALQRLPTAELLGERGLTQQIYLRSMLTDHNGVLELWQNHPELRASASPETLRLVAIAMADEDTDGAYELVNDGLTHPNLVPEDRVILTSTLGIIRFNQSNYTEAEQRFAETIELAHAIGPSQHFSAMHFNHALALRFGAAKDGPLP